MMQKIVNPLQQDWPNLIKRAEQPTANLEATVKAIFDNVQLNGDAAVSDYTKQFDGIAVQNTLLTKAQIAEAVAEVDSALKSAIELAATNIKKFHLSQQPIIEKIETQPGVVCWRENRAIENVGIYIPGGTAPLFSTVLMLGIPATIAGCKNIVLVTPPNKQGEVNPAIIFAAQLIGITQICCVGGIQAIAALTFGTSTIPKVDKIFGPGNQYVTAAKQYAQQFAVAIDMPAGPSEVLVIADENTNPIFAAADLLSQAEHGIDSQAILLCTNDTTCNNILQEVATQLEQLPRKDIAAQALLNSKAIVLNSLDECIAWSNLYASEHLILMFDDAVAYVSKVKNAGSIFLGQYSCEALGDYASGTNHTLPTNGYARQYSGVSLDSFVKKITVQQVSAVGIKNIGPFVEIMAQAENLFAHKNAVTVRLKSL
jgi:histidinol dehydrogenase